MNRAEINRLHTRIFEAASEVYTELGQGLDLQIYYTCFLHELRLKGLMFKRDIAFPVYYKEIKTNKEVFIGILVENQTIVELITDIEITNLHISAMMAKLKIARKRMGIIITFNAPGVTEGYRKVINSI
jgi:GxxExxY protein